MNKTNALSEESGDDTETAVVPVEDSVAEAAAEVPVLRSQSSLSLTQCRALESLMSGHSMSAAAKGAGVARATLYRWMNEDPQFRAAHNSWQKDTISAVRSSILALTEPALRAVAAQLEAGDGKMGLALLKSLGMLAPPSPGSTEVADVRKEQQIEKKRKETDLFIADLAAGFPK